MNKLTHFLGLRYPIVQGGMGNISPVQLCVAVSQAGGLGQIGVGSLSLQEIEKKLLMVKSGLGRLPFGVNLPLSVQPKPQEVIELLIHHHVPVISLSAGNPAPWIDSLKAAGSKVMVVVSTVKQAQKAEAAGADVLIAEGFEAAGKNSPKERTTFTLLPEVVAVSQLPVLAAGGIGDGKGLLAAFSLGASGVQLGTRLIMTQEAGVHPTYQQTILQATGEDTLVLGRSIGLVTRLLATPYARKVSSLEQQGIDQDTFLQLLGEEPHYKGAILGLLEEGHLNAGQIVGLIKDIPRVKELFATMWQEAQERSKIIHQLMNQEGEKK